MGARHGDGVAALVALACAGACLVGVVVRQEARDRSGAALLGGQRGETTSLASLERERARLRSFIAREGGTAPDAPRASATDGKRRSDRGGVAQGDQRWPDAESRRWHEALEQREAEPRERGSRKRCGKLCQTRKMILKARGRIDAQAHVELQQLAVSLRDLTASSFFDRCVLPLQTPRVG